MVVGDDIFEDGVGQEQGVCKDGEVQVQVNQLIVRMDTDERYPSPRGRNVYQMLCGATYKVLSFGMWLKLATDSRLMLLLLRVLRREKIGEHNAT